MTIIDPDTAYAEAILATRPGSLERSHVLLDAVLTDQPAEDLLADPISDVIYNIGQLAEIVSAVGEFLQRDDVAALLLDAGDPELAQELHKVFTAVDKAGNVLAEEHDQLNSRE